MSYCFNLNCQHPQNQSDAILCQSCGCKLLLKDRYRAIRKIGSGNFSRTFLAIEKDTTANQPTYAIKQFLLQAQNSDLPKAIALFNQEAQLLYNLEDHVRVPKLVSHFQQDGCLYLVQTYITGLAQKTNLADELAQGGAFNEVQILQLLSHLLPVLQHIHSKQIIHGNIKPQNIIRYEDKQFFLVDFGLAKLGTSQAIALVHTAYTAPEQMRGRVTVASDLYSLGVTCLHLLTNVSPANLFSDDEAKWIWRDRLVHPMSEQLKVVLDKMLESATNRRYQSAVEIIQAIASILSTSKQLNLPTLVVSTPSASRTLQGLEPVQLNPNLWGYANQQGQVVTKLPFEEAREFSEGLAAVKLNSLWGFINFNGEIVIKPQFYEAGNFHHELARVILKSDHLLHGFIYRSGELAIDYQFGNAGDFYEGLAKVTTPRSDKFGFIDRSGKLVIEYQFDDAGDFHEDLAKVGVGKWYGGYGWKFDGRYGFTNKTGVVVIQPEFDDVTDYQQGIAQFKITSRESIPIHGFIDQTGHKIIELPYCDIKWLSEGIAAFKSESTGEWGFADRTGVIAKPHFKEIQPFQNGRAKVLVKSLLGREKWRIVDKTGKFVDK